MNATATPLVTFGGVIDGRPLDPVQLSKDEAKARVAEIIAAYPHQQPLPLDHVYDEEGGRKVYYRLVRRGERLVAARCAGYAWIITRDCFADASAAPGTNANAKGVVGPSFGLPLTAAEIRKHPKAERFRMLGDDGEVAYYGFFVDEHGSAECCFGPLDDFGTPNFGCTTIQYFTNKVWKTV